MFSKASGKKVHAVIMDQLKEIEGTMLKFESFLTAATAKGTPVETLRALAKSVDLAEDAADEYLSKMIYSLGGTFLPSTKEDLIAVASSCDKIANRCESAAKMIVLQKYAFPADFAEELNKICKITHEQFSVLTQCIGMLFSNFGDLLEDHSILDKIHTYEHQVDVIEDSLKERVFDMDIELAYKMQTVAVLSEIADIADIIEDVADKIQILLITRKA